MAVTETVKIVFEADTKAITDTTKELTSMKKATEEDVAAFKKLSDTAKQANASIEETGDKFVRLRTQVKQAKDEVQRMADEFGESSVQFQQARLRAGQLADQMEDLNRIVKLSNPEAQAQAYVNFGNSVLGAFQIATGALQAFGVENEKLQKIATRLQGALNLAQGVASIGKLKESFADLKIILGLTATAQGSLNKATDTGINASEILKQTQTSTTLALNASKIATGELTNVTNAASAAWARFTAVLARNPLTFLAVAIAAVAGAYLVLSKNTNDATKSVDNLAEAKKKLNNAQENSIENAANESAELKILIERAKLAKNSSIERNEALQEINKKYGTTLKNISDENELLKQLDATYIKLTETIQKKALAAAIEDELKKIYAEQVKLELESIRNQEKIAEKRKESAMNANLDNVAAANFQKNLLNQVETLNKVTTDNRKKQLQESIDFLSKELAITSAGIDATYAKNKQEEIKLIKTLGVEASKSQSDVLKLNENAFNRLQLVYAILESSPLDVAKSIQKLNDELDKIGPKTVEITKTSSEMNQEAFAADEERAQASRELFAETQDFILSLSQSSFTRQQQLLEEQKEKGIITEEQYQEKLKKIKQNQAKQDKELAIFSATVAFAEALVKALTTKNPPAALILAAAVGGLNLAKIIATPLPKFKDGTLSVPGVDTGQDTVMAMLRPGEAVIPTETNREYAPALRAIYRRDINAKELNDFVTNREQGAFAFNQVSLDALYKRDLKVSAITAAGKTAQLNVQPTKITADVDVQQLTRAMSKNKAVEVTNTAALGEAIAAQLSKRINPRQVI